VRTAIGSKRCSGDNQSMALAQAVTPDVMRAEKRRVTLNSVVAAMVITCLKIVVGVATGSLGVLSEAAHSGLDLIAALITFFSVRVSDKPADADHQYGHGKVENFSAFIETGLLVLTMIWIVGEAVLRLLHRETHIEPTPFAFAVMLLSMGVDAWRSRALRRVANKYDSQALEADALHFRTDIWSSAVVIVGLALVVIGKQTGVTALISADAIAALFVGAVVLYVSWRLARQTIDALLDAAPAGVRARIMAEVAKVEGVIGVERARTRRAGNRYFVDMSVALSRHNTFQRSQEVSHAVTDAVRRLLPNADVIVDTLARPSQAENVFDKIRGVATRNNVMVHDVSVQDLGGGLHVEQHLELDERLTLKEAHDRVTRLEAEMREGIPEISSILTHIESEPATIETGEEIARRQEIENSVKAIARKFPEIIDVHEVHLRRVRDHLYLSLHCTMADDLPLSRVHDVQTALEIRLKQHSPELFRVLIHPEPNTDNRR
jgi:cation diffusion facilitator family transporter